MDKKTREKNQAYWAWVRQSENLDPLVESSALSEDEAESIKRICQLRHKIHANRTEESLFYTESCNYHSAIEDINELQSLIGHIVFTDDEPTDCDLYYDVIHEEYTGEYTGSSEDNCLYMTWALSYIRNKVETLNDLAEQFLKDFDEKFDTKLAPTGAFRRLI